MENYAQSSFCCRLKLPPFTLLHSLKPAAITECGLSNNITATIQNAESTFLPTFLYESPSDQLMAKMMQESLFKRSREG